MVRCGDVFGSRHCRQEERMDSSVMQLTNCSIRDCCWSRNFQAETVKSGKETVVVHDEGDNSCYCSEKIVTAGNFRKIQMPQKRLSSSDVATSFVPRSFVSVD